MFTLKSLIPKRKWFRFSLGTFLLAVALFAFGCKWVLDRVHLCAGQYDLLDRLAVDLGPPVPGGGGGGAGRYRGKHIGAFDYRLAAPTGWEKTVADWLGIKYEVDVVLLGFRQPSVDLAKAMEVAARMPKLKSFFLRAEPITKDVVVAIDAIQGIESLSLENTEISDDEALDALQELQGLKTLDFHSTDVSEREAAVLKRALANTHIRVYRELSVNQDQPNGNTEYVAAIDLP